MCDRDFNACHPPGDIPGQYPAGPSRHYIWEYATFQFLLILISILVALTLICIAASAAQRKRALNLQETKLEETITLRPALAAGAVTPHPKMKKPTCENAPPPEVSDFF